jgi:hypothetical protein
MNDPNFNTIVQDSPYISSIEEGFPDIDRSWLSFANSSYPDNFS